MLKAVNLEGIVRSHVENTFPHSLVAHKGPADDGKRSEVSLDTNGVAVVCRLAVAGLL